MLEKSNFTSLSGDERLEITGPHAIKAFMGWMWASDWVVERDSENTDDDGWQYATSFSIFETFRPDNYTGSFVRRRRRSRLLKKTLVLPVDAMSYDDSDPAKSFGDTMSSAMTNIRGMTSTLVGIDSEEYFHQLFPDLEKHESVLQSYSCCIKKDIPIQGRLYLTKNFMCFYAFFFGFKTQHIIPLSSVTKMEKANVLIVISNAIKFYTDRQEYLFARFFYRNTTYDEIKTVWEKALLAPSSSKGTRVLYEESPEMETLGDCLATLTKTPVDIVQQHAALITSCDDYDNQECSYTEANGTVYLIECRTEVHQFSANKAFVRV